MEQPVLLLVIAVVASLATIAVLHPRQGLRSRLHAARLAAERARLEDALKHLYNAEYEGTPAGVESLAGRLGIAREEALDLLGRVERLGLLSSRGSRLELTEEGRAYAVRIVRSHRLWERYLAEHTGLHPAEWHAQAERREHTLTPEEAHDLSARLGHPRYDPHGDPIPSLEGGLPPARGVPLDTLDAGDAAVVLHVEDEPRPLYDRLVGAGLGPGARLEVLPVDEPGVRVRVAGRVQELEPLLAANVAVERLTGAGEAEALADVVALADVEPGAAGSVVRISPACRGPQRRRLLDLGVVPGTEIAARYGSVSGDPVAYEIRGALIALRRNQAEQILVRRVPAGDAGRPAEKVG